ncbi:HNH homing endonuclease [Salmonella phage D5lw]|nr:HNH homing endonuclease [Salmonella phage D5lw]
MSKKLVCGVGLNDTPERPARVGGKMTADYMAWTAMLQRVYDPKYHGRQPTYLGCSVVKEWLKRSCFIEWFDGNYVAGWYLDKDILKPGNKEYGPETCIYVPGWLNTFINDSRAIRGNLPIGVSLHKPNGKYLSQCKNFNTTKNLGYYKTPSEAHEAWLEFKLNLALERKHEMDKIDLRIYPNVVNNIKRK